MQGGRRLVAWLSLLAAAGTLDLGCGSSERDRPAGAALPKGSGGSKTGGTGGTGGSSAGRGGSSATGTGGAGGSGGTGASAGSSVITVGMSGTGDAGPTPDCGGEDYEPTLVPLDLYVMLDSSSSMLEDAGSSTKWEAIQGALTTFLADPASSGIGIGLQFFPQHDPKVPDTCKLIADCGSDDNVCVRNFCKNAGPDFYVCDTDADCRLSNKPADDYGPCTRLTYCWSSGGAVPCHNDSDCNNTQGDCVEIGKCTDDANYICPQIGSNCLSQTGGSLGPCIRDEDTQCQRTSNCDPSVYNAPAAEIATLPDAAGALTAVITKRMPDGRTPSAPALQGALDHARAWAKANPTHSVAVVLATDGLPTECIANVTADPSGVDEVVAEAKNGVDGMPVGSPSISTFVIGVFSQSDDAQLMAGMNLDRIAAAGGTDAAHVIHTGSNTEQEFLSALDAIRGTRLPCNFQIPTPTNGTTFDKNKVNVVYTHDGQTTKLYYWESASDCDATAGGWYYDDANAPTKIIACPASCTAFQASSSGDPSQMAAVSIELGCDTFKEPR